MVVLPTLPLDWCSIDVEYLEQLGRNSRRASCIGYGWGMGGSLILYTTASELAKISWKDETLTVSEEVDHHASPTG